MRKKRLYIVVLIAVGVALYFWIASRYPQLSEKEMMVRTSSGISDTLVTWPKIRIREEYPFWRKVEYSTINWCWENRKGMTFGVILAALLQTIFSYFQTVVRANGALNALYGVILGVPLGVCVNCAAPIFKGVLRSRRTETAFATMLSSPTLNIVVLTMVFTVFPLYMGLIKVGFTLAVIFLGVPLISRFLGKDHVIKDISKLEPVPVPLGGEALQSESWGPALGGALKDSLRNLIYMTLATVPLMFLAGFLGAVITHAMPTTSFIRTEAGFPAVALAALVGVALPVPVAFDVILTNALYALGLPPNLVLTFLCTLGIFSVYSFFIVWTSASRKWALLLFALIFGMGTAVGLAGRSLHEWFYVDRNLTDYRELKRKVEAVPAEPAAEEEYAAAPSIKRPKADPIRFERFRQQGDVSVYRSELRAKPKYDGPPFIKKEGHELGLTRGYRYEIRDYPDPFWLGRGTAAGDFDGDGWDDLVFGTNHGFALYRNMGGWFEPVVIPNPELLKYRVYAVAFVDLNNDGWLDLFFTTFDQGNYVILNHKGTFDFFHPIQVPNGNGILTVSPGFADLAGHGFLDILNGNMALGIVTGFHHYGQGRASTLTYNDGLRFTEANLGGDSGETMTTLISDLNGDGYPDIYLGHDYVFPDQIFLGGPGGFRQVRSSDGLIARTPVYSMSADIGDVNGDGLPDLLLTGTIARRPFVDQEVIDGVAPEKYSEEKWDVRYCARIQDEVLRRNCERVRKTVVPFQNARNLDLTRCAQIDSPTDREGCLLATMWLMITNDFLAYDCEKKFDFDDLLKRVCLQLSRRGDPLRAEELSGSLPQEDGSFLYLGDRRGGFTDINDPAPGAKPRYRPPGGWTWNTKIVDLDNDGWPDIFNAEGVVRTHDYGWNGFMKNLGGGTFEPRQFSYNLTDDFNLITYSLLDTNNDGTLDIIGNSSVGPVQVYLNHSTAGNQSLVVSLRDYQGNRFGVGARITIRYDGGRKTQLREIKASGGYQSFDPLKAYFGLGSYRLVSEIRVRWRDGKETVLGGPFRAGYHYRVERGKNQ